METKKRTRPPASKGHSREARDPAAAQRRKAGQTRRPASKGRSPSGANVEKRQAPDASTQARARQARRRSQARRTAQRQAARPAPEVVYTPPKPFSRSRLLLQLVSVVAVVLALTFGMSIFFKVEHITVSGAEKYSAWTVKEASGIQVGDSLLGFGEIKASSNIIAQLPYVKDVRIGIKLPDTVNIVVEELDVAYSVADDTGVWWLMTSEGKVVDRLDTATPTEDTEYTQVLGVSVFQPVPGQQAVAFESSNAASTDPTAQIQEQLSPVSVTDKERLDVALSILRYLEEVSMMGLVASVNVADLSNIQLWYGQQYQVRLGDTTQLAHKIDWMQKAISQLADYDSGLLDISFTLVEDQVIYDQFGEE